MVTQLAPGSIEWVLLSYRIPREPSTPRIAVWRKLRRIGAGHISDGLAALPNDARTREHFEWIAADVLAADGDASVWVANTSRLASENLAQSMRAARDAEFHTLIDEVAAAGRPIDGRTLKRLRRTQREIERRDYFRAPSRDRSRLAIEALVTEYDAEVSA